MHTFLLANAAILFSLLLTKIILRLSFIKNNLSQLQKLRFARVCFIASMIIFMLMPYCKTWHAIQPSKFTPLVFQQASAAISHSQAVITTQLSNTQHMPLQLPLRTLLIIAWLIGVVIYASNYWQTLSILRKTTQQSYCQHQLKNIAVLFNEINSVPFCWSWFNKHFIVLPFFLLEKHGDKNLAIRHELQHIRQGDTFWLHFLNCLQIIFFLNPFFLLWKKYFNDLQEFACDEEIILRRKTSPLLYAQCLINAAEQATQYPQITNGIIAIHGMCKSTLYRRVNMLFNYKTQSRKYNLIAAYVLGFCTLTTTAFAINNAAPATPITTDEITTIIQQSNLAALQITASPEVIAEINHIRSDENARHSYQAGLKRMKEYQPFIQQQLVKNAMPNDLLAMPLMQTRYQPLDESKNRVKAAGIWQIIPSTAKNLGLIVDNNHDERLDTERSTQAALNYLTQLHNEFHDWKLAVIGYELGEKATEQLITATGSRDPWVLARSPQAPKQLKDYLAMFDAAVIIIHKPALING